MAQNEIFYEKYRPRQISHVIGQDSVVKILKKSCEKNFFHHSYLLSGKHGTGKTSVSRIIATLLTCQNRQVGSFVTCGRCEACRSVQEGNAIDVFELDGASNSKIENTRSIIESSRYTPQQFKKKVFIIDECHRLSKAAMTSLLKTLEEPPETSVFILCTTEFESVPKEIVDRCQRLNFRPVSPAVISSFLNKLFTMKKIEFDQTALDTISITCHGSVRNALEISQEVIVLSEGKVTDENISELLGFIGRKEIYGIVEAISNADLLKAFDILENSLASGIDCRSIVNNLSEIFRSIMIGNISFNYVSDLTQSEREFINKIKSNFSAVNLANYIGIFEEAERSFDVNINNRWVLEAVVVKVIEKQKS